MSRVAVVKRSVTIAGHRTSVSMEDAFWAGLRNAALARTCPPRCASRCSTTTGTGATLRREIYARWGARRAIAERLGTA